MKKEDRNTIIEQSKIDNILKENGKCHNYYKYYSKKTTIQKIVQNKCMFASDGREWNDLVDARDFNSDDNCYRFGICFSSYQAESVAMWMLYGGKGKDGAMIDFTGTINKLPNGIKGKSLELFTKNEKGYLPINKRVKIIDSYFYDVAYCSKNGLFFKANGENYLVESFDDIISKEKIAIKKDYQWHYEKETRLVFEVDKKNIINLIKEYNNLYLKIDINEYLTEKVLTTIKESPMNDYKINYVSSDLCGKIDWDID